MYLPYAGPTTPSLGTLYSTILYITVPDTTVALRYVPSTTHVGVYDYVSQLFKDPGALSCELR